ncbi:YjbH domain-containing protein [Pseudaestuariivita sp.]|uniref:YjbH domain-containing protein n=1 Tax=Pseudaestuariivita sp. TaxID=2211669 RepID=UPI004059A7E0
MANSIFSRRTRSVCFVSSVSLALMASAGMAQERPTSFSLYGVPGLIDMPNARMAPDATLSTTISNFGNNTRTTLAFQIAPRLQGAFRYSAIRELPIGGSVDGVYYDRSFDVRYQVLKEGQYWPSVVIGLQDAIGTGLYGAEYIVATKEVVPGLSLTGGIGWGRLGSNGAFGNTGTRPDDLLAEGGVPTYDRWFRGDVAGFGGISYSPNDRLTLKAEYSSDAYDLETEDGGFERQSDWNFGLDYRFKRGNQLSFYYAYGAEIGAQFTLHTNPKLARVPGGVETAPNPVQRRDAVAARDLGWVTEPNTQTSVRQALKTSLARDGLEYQGFESDGRRAVLRMRNGTYQSSAQAVGRAARIMTRLVPDSVSEFVIIPVVNGLALSAITLQRGDLENLENAKATAMLERAVFTDAFGQTPELDTDVYPKFRWSLSPYLSLSVFDPDSPVRADVGARLKARYEFTPNLVASGSVTQRLGGDLDSIERPSNSVLPRVRTNFNRFSNSGDTTLEHLTLTGYTRLGPEFYGRATIGYLEPMYAGASAEVLWKPVNSRLALGAEVNAVRQRDYDQGFGLGDCDDLVANENFEDCTLITGHLSAYYDFGNGYHGQLDVGQYLAGDRGATVALDREFGNGWRVGAYATFTDVSAEDFGEGSFDKGIRVTIPLGWATGTPSRRTNDVVIQSLTRDGGAKLDVGGRLYERVRDYHRPDMEKSWGRFWR